MFFNFERLTHAIKAYGYGLTHPSVIGMGVWAAVMTIFCLILALWAVTIYGRCKLIAATGDKWQKGLIPVYGLFRAVGILTGYPMLALFIIANVVMSIPIFDYDIIRAPWFDVVSVMFTVASALVMYLCAISLVQSFMQADFFSFKGFFGTLGLCIIPLNIICLPVLVSKGKYKKSESVANVLKALFVTTAKANGKAS